MAKKNDNIFAMVLAGVGALVAALIGVNELSKSRSNIKGSTGSVPGFQSPKKSGCGCGA